MPAVIVIKAEFIRIGISINMFGVPDLQIFVISSFRKKILYILIIALLWVLAASAAGLLFRELPINRLLIENYMSFSCPSAIRVTNIYVLRGIDEAIETNLTLGRYSCRQFNSYESIEGKISFDYPVDFTLSPQKLPGNEIIYHIDYTDDREMIRGFVQVWNLEMPLERFLKGSLETSNIRFLEFKSGNAILDSMPGILWEYTLRGNDGIEYKGMEVFAQENEKMFRISCFVPLKDWNKKTASVFWKMVKSFKVLP